MLLRHSLHGVLIIFYFNVLVQLLDGFQLYAAEFDIYVYIDKCIETY